MRLLGLVAIFCLSLVAFHRELDAQSSAVENLSELAGGSESCESCASTPCICTPADGWIQAGSQPGSLFFSSTDTAMKLGGYVKLDGIYDFQDAGNRFLFDPNSIPVDGGRGAQSTLSARQSRLFLDTTTPFDGRDLRLYFEADFFDDFDGQGDFRLRRAFGEFENFLAGKEWVLAVDLEAIPETLDFNGPQGNALARQAQIRWTTRPTDNITWANTLHEPRHQTLTTVPGEQRDRIPIFTSSLRFKYDSGHVYLYGGTGENRFVPDVGSPVTAAIWGAGLSIRQQLGRDHIILQGGVAEGLIDFLPNFTSDQDIVTLGIVDPLPTYGLVAAYQHKWNDSLRSNLTYRTAIERNSALQLPGAIHQNQYLAVNLIRSLLKNRVDIGVEYLYGVRENKDGQKGDANRLMFSFIYRLP